jgi:Phage integrase family
VVATTSTQLPSREVTRALIVQIAGGEQGAKLRSQVTRWHPGATCDQVEDAFQEACARAERACRGQSEGEVVTWLRTTTHHELGHIRKRARRRSQQEIMVDFSAVELRIPDAKTDAGVREVQLSPDLVEELVAHVDRLRRAGLPTHPGAHLFPNSRGGRMARQRVSRIVSKAAGLATERLVARGLPPLPVTTPHSLRRTYVSIALLANNFDVMWVMSQVGHADSKMTMDVYAQLQQRVPRDHGRAFDALVRRARERLYGVETDPIGPRIGPRGPEAQVQTRSTDRPENDERA